MELRILGSGSCSQSVERGSAGYLLKTCGKTFLIDAGPGVCRQLSRYGIDLGSIDEIFISHFHIDHVNDIPAILFSRKHFLKNKPKTDLVIHGPAGFHKNLKNLLLSYGEQIITDDYKIKVIEHLDKESEQGLRVKAIEGHQRKMKEEDEVEKEDTYIEEVVRGYLYKSGAINISMAEMEHSLPCLGFRFEYNSSSDNEKETDKTDKNKLEPKDDEPKDKPAMKSFTYSGDTSPCNNIIRLAANTDCLLMEATSSDNAPLGGHTTSSQAGAVAKKAGAKTLLLTHISPENDETDIEGIASQFYDGIVIAARDGMRLTI